MIRTATFAVIALGLAAGAAQAQVRLVSRAAPCAAVAATVAREGEVILYTSPYAYDRIVSGLGQCSQSMTAKATFAPTADVPQCLVGYRCVDRMRDNSRF